MYIHTCTSTYTCTFQICNDSFIFSPHLEAPQCQGLLFIVSYQKLTQRSGRKHHCIPSGELEMMPSMACQHYRSFLLLWSYQHSLLCLCVCVSVCLCVCVTHSENRHRCIDTEHVVCWGIVQGNALTHHTGYHPYTWVKRHDTVTPGFTNSNACSAE